MANVVSAMNCMQPYAIMWPESYVDRLRSGLQDKCIGINLEDFNSSSTKGACVPSV